MTSRKPVLLLDLDGVVNSFSVKPPKYAWPAAEWKTGSAVSLDKEYPLLWSTAVVGILNALHWEGNGKVEVRFHTSWQADAWNFADVVGLYRFPIQPCPEYPTGMESEGELIAARLRDGLPGWWKYFAAERVLAEERRPLIWVDDDITWELPRVRRDRMAQLGEVLLISPDKYTGLMPKHFKLIDEFVKEVA